MRYCVLSLWKYHSDLPNRYGEEKPAEIVVIEFNSPIATHHHEWTIGKKKMESLLSGGTWSSFNNCMWLKFFKL
jgi:hypothetical protein